MRAAWDTSLGLGGLLVLLSQVLAFYRVLVSGGLRGAPLRALVTCWQQIAPLTSTVLRD
ncbi:hypothetical protein L227DRAFT_578241 [Lentinus tigrinus ALCF2SS1-6]|uniref:Uncharacterized protein n=1 Tax=Lentinus tigrinus ALCF2SS1-6 TaxID=1328759 RepID=A0A5C2S113_9APHY|nr:hypothetical protein L227DRAFT_578241 [Lentinus tigrinus ALCF2SS1-6]